MIGPQGRAIEIRILGDNFDRLQRFVAKIKSSLARYNVASNPNDDLQPRKEEVRISLREGVSVLGLDASNMAHQLCNAFQGVATDEVHVSPESLEIDVRLHRRDQNSLADPDDY